MPNSHSIICLCRVMRILIAEDDSILADGLSRSLRYEGYAVDVVHDGDSADSALQLQSFDLLILDLDLPKKTACRCCSQSASARTPCPF